MMEILKDITTARSRFREITKSGKTLGLVPTMGALHEGHLSLVHQAAADNDMVAVSIFVNPAQFDNSDDLKVYPRDLEADRNILKKTAADLIFYPSTEDIYPDNYHYQVTETENSLQLEGAYRKGYFDGVLTVVLKLLNIAGADRAYFGEKDWQQLSLIKGMTQAFFMNTEIVSCSTVRENDGLAMSSRNALLSPSERKIAPDFHRILTSPLTPEDKTSQLENAGFTVDYIKEMEGRVLGAVHLGRVRLIDNVEI